MVKGLIGEKVEMTQIFDSHGRVVPVTKVRVAPSTIVQIKTNEKDGYKVVQIGMGEKKKAAKSILGHVKKAGLEKAPRIIREVEVYGEVKIGDKISPDQFFKRGVLLDVTGISKGKGFAGVVKRWGFAGGPRTHGQSDNERAPGSIGASATPSRVFKGMKMAGHMGSDRTTVQGLEVMDLDVEKGEILVRGSIPGSRGTYLLLRKSKSKKKTYHEPEIPEKPVGPKEENQGSGDNGSVNGEQKPPVDKNQEEKAQPKPKEDYAQSPENQETKG